jgi:transcriptional regulator GlxA family with amidase domain
MLGVPASAILDARVDAADLLGARARQLGERLAGATSSKSAARELESAMIAWALARNPIDRLIERAVAALRTTSGATPVAALANDLGTTERQLNRRCVAAIGYGPKVLHRVLRMRRFLTLAGAPSAPGLSALAAHAGYADQAHMTRDCLELTGLTPARLRGRRITSG